MEWLPVSSSGFIVLISMLLGSQFLEAIDIALALHLGSGLAAFLALYRDIVDMVRASRSIYGVDIRVYALGLPISILVALAIYSALARISMDTSLAMVLIGVGLIATSIAVQRRGGGGGLKRVTALDIVALFILQGMAILPGVSRSGLVLAYLGYRGVEPEKAFRINLVVAIPILILAGVYGLYTLAKSIGIEMLIVAQLIVFVVSYLIIRYMLHILRKVSTWVFTMFIGIALVATSIPTLLH